MRRLRWPAKVIKKAGIEWARGTENGKVNSLLLSFLSLSLCAFVFFPSLNWHRPCKCLARRWLRTWTLGKATNSPMYADYKIQERVLKNSIEKRRDTKQPNRANAKKLNWIESNCLYETIETLFIYVYLLLCSMALQNNEVIFSVYHFRCEMEDERTADKILSSLARSKREKIALHKDGHKMF